MNIQKLVASRHPKYEDSVKHWDFLEACYAGGRDWFTKDNIFRYMKEGDREYRDRLKRAYRFNHSREVVDLVNKYLFRAEVVRSEDASPKLVRFWTKATRKGLSINEFAEMLSAKVSTFGSMWVVVDSDVPEGVLTEAELERFHGPYVYAVKPADVLDFSEDDKGQLNWVLIREWVRDDARPGVSSGKITPRYRLWERDRWSLFGKKGNSFVRIKGGKHDLDEVPVFRADNSFSADKYCAPSLIADIAYLDRACANYASNLDAIIQDQTFSQLAMPAQGLLPGDDAEKDLIKLGTNRVFVYDGEGGAKPLYLSPDPRQAQLIIAAIQQLINEIYHSVGLAGERTKQDNAKGIDNSSGVAKERDFERVTALLRAKAHCMETAENNIARLVCKWNGEDYQKDLVAYSDDFNVRGLHDEVAILTSLLAVEAPASMLQSQMEAVVRKAFPGVKEAIIKQMKEEVAGWAKRLESNPVEASVGDTQAGRLLEEARRNRAQAAEKQSATIERKTAQD